ncbi:MAG: glucose 1-dehydrogenase [Deltaproteobacteria bacterium]|nr:glucose 1-dehydrogenase [Deltaproteobacteria bacterium]
MVLEKFRVDGKVALVTGGGRGIGRASALALAEAGADVVVAARRQDTLDEVCEAVTRMGRRALGVATDVCDEAQRAALIERALSAFGGVDILVNNAGGWPPTAAIALERESFEEAFRFNVIAGFELSKGLAPTLHARKGCIVNISSAMGHLVDSGFVAYGACKAALDHMTRLLAREWAPTIRVNAVAAGATLTDALGPFVDNEELMAEMCARTPLGRLGEADEIAATVLFLASPAGAWVTGKVFEIDGGTTASNWPWPMPNGL